MSPARSQLAIALAVMGLAVLPTRSWPEARQGESRAAGQAPSAGTQPAEVPAGLEQVPPGGVVVFYADGSLTIKARGAPLINVLREACSKLGAELDAPPGATETVSAIWGPGPPKEVLTALLNRTGFGYAMAGSATDLGALSFLAIFSKATEETKAAPTDGAPSGNEPKDASAHGRPGFAVTPSATQAATDALAQVRAIIADNSEGGDPAAYDLIRTRLAEAEAAIPEPNSVQAQSSKQSDGSDPVTPSNSQPVNPSTRPHHRHR